MDFASLGLKRGFNLGRRRVLRHTQDFVISFCHCLIVTLQALSHSLHHNERILVHGESSLFPGLRHQPIKCPDKIDAGIYVPRCISSLRYEVSSQERDSCSRGLLASACASWDTGPCVSRQSSQSSAAADYCVFNNLHRTQIFDAACRKRRFNCSTCSCCLSRGTRALTQPSTPELPYTIFLLG